MRTNINDRRRQVWMHLGMAGVLLLSACAESTPDTVVPPPAEEIPPAALAVCIGELAELAPSQVTAPEILGVCDDGERFALVFSAFYLDAPLDVTNEEFYVTVAKLQPEVEGYAGPQWQSYINQVEDPTAATGDWPGTAPAIQATAERGTGLLRVEADGIYSYVLDTDLRNVTEPVAVSWQPELTHRVSMEFRGGLQNPALGNPSWTWLPDAADGVPVTTRQIAANTACIGCHESIAAHGGARVEIDNCVMCHNPGTVDANSGELLHFGTMIHRIHMGSHLPSVEAGEDFVIWGFRNSPHDFSDVHYPQDQRNCLRCHNPADEATPDAERFRTDVSVQACVACHDNVVFGVTQAEFEAASYAAHQTWHTGGAQTASDSCAACHGPTATHSVDKMHATRHSTPHNPQVPEGYPSLTYEILDVTGLGAGEQPVVTFRILNHGDPVDLTSLPAGLGMNGSNTPRLVLISSSPQGRVAEPADWNNIGLGQQRSQPRLVTIQSILGSLTANPDGSYTTTAGNLGTVPADSTMAAIGMEGRMIGPDGQVGAPSVIVGADGDVAPRRQIVDNGKCATCHEELVLHGTNRISNVNYCAVCHNPNATDVGRRPGGAAAGGVFNDYTLLGSDGLHERPIDLRELIHKIHMGSKLHESDWEVYGFSGAFYFGDIHYPNNQANCLSCHLPGTYELPLDPNALATTKLVTDVTSDMVNTSQWVWASDNPDKAASTIGPAAAACTGCHDSVEALAHAQASQAYWSKNIHGTEADSCAACHGPGKMFDVRNVHGLAGVE